ncbi:MAG: hypothetical protein AAGH15_02330 [Myxococcota bacterium]
MLARSLFASLLILPMACDGGSGESDAGLPDAALADAGLADAGGVDDAGGADSDGGLVEERELAASPGCPTADPPGILPIVPEECGHWSAARFPARTERWEVVGLGYELDDDSNPASSAPGLAHRVRLFAAPGERPPAELSSPLTLEVAATTWPEGMDREVELRLDAPFVVEAGQALYVAFEMVCSPMDRRPALGLELCASDPGSYWWSQAAEAPYDWATHESFDLDPAVPQVDVTYIVR